MGKIKWVPESKLLQNGKFKNCPYCHGEIIQKRYGGIIPIWGDPVCKDCRRRFIPKRKWLFKKGFYAIID